MGKEPEQRPVTVEFDGKTYGATYTATSCAVTVTWYTKDAARRIATTQTRGTGENDAQILLREILSAAKDRGEL